uniref:Uncharacterized protein n=1 Tax=Fagus sylvatica TaxID=28930 RepID=A0A2N9FJS3_FAGSY
MGRTLSLDRRRENREEDMGGLSVGLPADHEWRQNSYIKGLGLEESLETHTIAPSGATIILRASPIRIREGMNGGVGVCDKSESQIEWWQCRGGLEISIEGHPLYCEKQGVIWKRFSIKGRETGGGGHWSGDRCRVKRHCIECQFGEFGEEANSKKLQWRKNSSTYCGRLYNRAVSLIIVDPGLLVEPFGNKPSFVPVQHCHQLFSLFEKTHLQPIRCRSGGFGINGGALGDGKKGFWYRIPNCAIRGNFGFNDLVWERVVIGWVGGSGGSAGLRVMRGSLCADFSGVRLEIRYTGWGFFWSSIGEGLGWAWWIVGLWWSRKMGLG